MFTFGPFRIEQDFFNRLQDKSGKIYAFIAAAYEVRMDLFGMVVSGVVSFAVGESIRATIFCAKCNDRKETKIKNVSDNPLYCKNCNHELIQFTNVCERTLDKDHRVGHVMPKIENYKIKREELSKGFFSSEYREWLVFPFDFNAKDYKSKQFTIEASVSEYKSTTPILKFEEDVLKFETQKDTWTERRSIRFKLDRVPDEFKSNRIFAFDLTVRSDFGEILAIQRDLQKIEFGAVPDN